MIPALTKRFDEAVRADLPVVDVWGTGAASREFLHIDDRWDTSKPDGQPRRSLDTTKAKGLFGFRAEIWLEEGLQKTIAWYRQGQAQ